MLIFVLAFSYMVGNLKSFFDLDALFNEFLLGYILPIAILIKESKKESKIIALCAFLGFVLSIHLWAIRDRILEHFVN